MFENFYFIEKMVQAHTEEILHDVKQDRLVGMIKSRRNVKGFRVLPISLVNRIIRPKC